MVVQTRMMKARFVSPCPFCGMGVSVGKMIVLADNDEWMHPRCARFSNAGKTFKDMNFENKIMKRARELQAQWKAEQAVDKRDHSKSYF